MCYPKPGPRCSSHAAKKLLQAELALKNLKGDYLTDTKAYAKYSDLKDKVAEATLEYDATPAGQLYLKRRIDTKQHPLTEYELRYELGVAHRAAALEAIKAQDLGDTSHEALEKNNLRSLKAFFKKTSSLLPAGIKREGWKNDSKEVEGMIEESARWMGNLTPEEQEAAAWLTSDGAGAMNSYLLDDETNFSRTKYGDEHIAAQIDHLDSALAKYSSATPVVVYRGISDSMFPEHLKYADLSDDKVRVEYLDVVNEAFGKGSSYSSKAFMSTSYDPSKARGFSEGVILEIKTRKAAPVSNTSAWGVTEREAVFPRNTNLKVVDVLENVPYGKNAMGEESFYTVIQLEDEK